MRILFAVCSGNTRWGVRTRGARGGTDAVCQFSVWFVFQQGIKYQYKYESAVSCSSCCPIYALSIYPDWCKNRDLRQPPCSQGLWTWTSIEPTAWDGEPCSYEWDVAVVPLERLNNIVIDISCDCKRDDPGSGLAHLVRWSGQPLGDALGLRLAVAAVACRRAQRRTDGLRLFGSGVRLSAVPSVSARSGLPQV